LSPRRFSARFCNFRPLVFFHFPPERAVFFSGQSTSLPAQAQSHSLLEANPTGRWLTFFCAPLKETAFFPLPLWTLLSQHILSLLLFLPSQSPKLTPLPAARHFPPGTKPVRLPRFFFFWFFSLGPRQLSPLVPPFPAAFKHSVPRLGALSTSTLSASPPAR